MAVQGRQRAVSTLVRRAERVPGEDRGQAGAERGVAPLVPPPQPLPWAWGLHITTEGLLGSRFKDFSPSSKEQRECVYPPLPTGFLTAVSPDSESR